MRHYQTRKPHKVAKTIPIHGVGEDEGRRFHCWYCRFPCDVERDTLGGDNEREGMEREDYSTPTYGATNGDKLSGILVLGGSIEHFHVIMENGSDGNPKGILHSFKPVVAQGCPFCGSKNWRGDYP